MVRIIPLLPRRKGIKIADRARWAEIVGTAVKVGPKVTSVKVGDRVGVGAQISACLDCTQCNEDNETYCKKQQGTPLRPSQPYSIRD
jgi:threonine dehydrogenase-like Zn-dependent dehydrogenase